MKQDYYKAFNLYEKASRAGYASSMVSLGVMYEQGWGTYKDYHKAAELYRSAAQKGDPYGQNNLGLLYEKGRGVKQDSYKAAELYQKSAMQGLADGKKNLARLPERYRGEVHREDKKPMYHKESHRDPNISSHTRSNDFRRENSYDSDQDRRRNKELLHSFFTYTFKNHHKERRRYFERWCLDQNFSYHELKQFLGWLELNGDKMFYYSSTHSYSVKNILNHTYFNFPEEQVRYFSENAYKGFKKEIY